MISESEFEIIKVRWAEIVDYFKDIGGKDIGLCKACGKNKALSFVCTECMSIIDEALEREGLEISDINRGWILKCKNAEDFCHNLMIDKLS